MRGGETQEDREAFRQRFVAAYAAAIAAGRLLHRKDLATKVQRAGPTVGEWFKSGGALPDGGAMIRLPAALGCNGHWLLTSEGAMHDPVADLDVLYYRGGLAVLGEMHAAEGEIARRWAADAERARARAEHAPADPAAAAAARPTATEAHRKRSRKKRPHAG